MLTSILLPVYNGANYIASSIETILKQRGNWELIIQDDCSTDDTEILCKKYLSEKVKYYKNKTSLKCWGTLNEAATHANGELFRLFSHDDLMLDDDIILSEAYMINNPDIGLSFTNYDMIDQNGSTTGSSLDYIERNNDLKEKMSGSLAATKLYKWGCISGSQSNITLRREVYNKINHFDANMLYTGDFDLLSRAGIEFGIAYNPAKTCQIRFHPLQTSAEGARAFTKIKEIKIIIDYLLNHMNSAERRECEKDFSNIYGYYLIKQPLKQIFKGNFKALKFFIENFGYRKTVNSLLAAFLKK
ncbi:MAG: glycosyltransferase [Agriterribacter sp.]